MAFKSENHNSNAAKRFLGPYGSLTVSWRLLNDDKTALGADRSYHDERIEDLGAADQLNPQNRVIDMVKFIAKLSGMASGLEPALSSRSLSLLEDLPVPVYTGAIFECIRRLSNSDADDDDDAKEDDEQHLVDTVCKEYWTATRTKQRREMLKQLKEEDREGARVKKLDGSLDDVFYRAFHDFWTSSLGVDPSFIDTQCEKRLLGQSLRAAVMSLSEFTSAVANRSSEIRNLNAYFMKILKQNEDICNCTARRSPERSCSPVKPAKEEVLRIQLPESIPLLGFSCNTSFPVKTRQW